MTTATALIRANDHLAPAYNRRLKVRYGECDIQGVVFNANYLAYVDEHVDEWFAERLGGDYRERFDAMVKKAAVEWHGPARWRDVLELAGRVSRWGTTSFDVTVTGTVDGRPVFEALMLYVSVEPGAHTPTPVPAWVREALSRP